MSGRGPVCQGYRRAGAAHIATCDVAHADDHDLAQTAGKRGLPSHRVGVIEPALGERRRVEQHAIDVDQLAAPPGSESFDHVGEFGMVLLWDQRYASHRPPTCSSVLWPWAGHDDGESKCHSILKPVAFMIGIHRASSSPMNWCVAWGPESRIGSKPEAIKMR